MSKFASYDDLPFEVAYKLECLEHELQEGDITQKGYEKKKATLLAPYQELLEKSHTFLSKQQQQENIDKDTVVAEEEEEAMDFGPEPSAADVTDFLDFLPSPSHSPVENKGASLMKENHIQQMSNVKQSDTSSNYSPSPRQLPAPLPPPRNRPPPPQQQQQQYRPAPPTNFMPDNFGGRPPMQKQPQNWNQNNFRPFDPRMGPPPPPPPSGPGFGNKGFPMRPPGMNGFRPQAPPLPPSSSSAINLSMYNNRPPPPPQSYNGSFRPPPISMNGSSTPIHTNSPFLSQHSRSPSLDSKPSDFSGVPFSVRQSMDVPEPPNADWETASATTWGPNNMIGREPSIMSTPGRIRPSMSTGSALSNSTMDSSNYGMRRTPSTTSRGRSRYRDSYMATTFKAIEPAPQPRISLNDARDQMFLSDLAGRQMTPLKGRSITFPIIDSDKKTVLTDFNNLAEVLRFRSTVSSDRMKNAFVLVDVRGKESSSLTWEKLNARAEKIAHQLKEKGKVKSGDRVALIYRKSEVLEFIPALFGCFLAGVTAIPINAAEDLSELSFILNLTNISLILTTDHNHRAFVKDMQAKSMEFPASISWWKTNDMGTWYPSKKSPDYPVFKVPEIAYIEYAKASNGELKGVTVTHTSIMEQCAAFQACTTDTNVVISNGVVDVQPKRKGCPQETVVSYFEPRQQIGLVLSVLQSVYTGYFTVFASGSIIDTPAIWIYVISKYKATMVLADYPALKSVTKFYQANKKEVTSHSKKITPDLSSLQRMVVDTNTINPELNEYVADKLLRPLGNTDNPLEVVCPVLSLPEQGGKILSMRDNLGPVCLEEHVEREDQQEDGTTRSVLAPSGSNDIFECLFDADALKANKVTVLAAGAEARKAENINVPGRVRVESFGFCMPKTGVVIVDPDTATICPPDTLGEVWVNSPSFASGFWALPKHTDSIFNAHAIVVPSERPYPEVYGESFMRTGLSGTTIGGRLFILGSYEERVRQQRLGADLGIEDTYYANELLNTVSKRARIEKCTIFEVLIKNQHLPIIVCESSQSRSELPKLATEIDDALIEFHGLRMYAIIFVPENGLPKQLIHGRRAVHQLLTKRYFLQGQLNIRYLKIDVDRTIFNLAANEDPSKDLWLSRMAYDKAIRTGAIIPHHQHQHTGMEKVLTVLDDRTEYDISRFSNIVDILQWRTTMNPEEVAYTVSSLSGNNINTKDYSWRKLSYMSATVAAHLAKKGIKQYQKVVVMMPFGIEYIFTIYACLVLGVVPVPIEPIDPQQQSQRVTEFSKQMVEVSKDLAISAILTNAAGEDVLRHNLVKAGIKSNSAPKFKLPEIVNVSKAAKHHKTLGKESGYMIRPEWLSTERNTPRIILAQNSSDGRRVYVYLGHDTILNQCRTQKMTCQMRSQRGIVTTGLGTYEGLGFLYALFCGVYVGCSTVLIPTSDFYANPASFFESLQRYKTKDAFLTNALVQFAMNRMAGIESRHISLKGVQNLMLANDGRPKPLLYQHVARYFARQKLEKEAINTVYSHIGNPAISTRSYMLMEPISLSLDPYWLRQGIIRSMSLEEEPYGILLHDSGIVPCNTMVAIVNPETRMVCPSNVLGEIWVASDSNAKTFHDLDEEAHNFRFGATIAGSDPNVKYMRTGDFGFLWNVRRRIDNRVMHPVMEEGQCLYVLGPISETIVRNGLIHFPIDIEASIERSHPAIPPGGSIAFQLKDEVVVVVSVKSSDHALSVVALIVNAVLDNHSFLIDTVVVVHPNNFPRSKFGDKMRRKAMISYAEKKMTAIYVKRITNQNESLMLPLWTQSQLSLSDPNVNSDTHSIHTISRAQSSSDFNSDIDKASIVQQLVRQDTETSRRSFKTDFSVQSPH